MSWIPVIAGKVTENRRRLIPVTNGLLSSKELTGIIYRKRFIADISLHTGNTRYRKCKKTNLMDESIAY